jgi:hypothetical protein
MQQEGDAPDAGAKLGRVASTTRSRVASDKPGWFFSARDTVPIDTLAARATSRMVVAIGFFVSALPGFLFIGVAAL